MLHTVFHPAGFAQQELCAYFEGERLLASGTCIILSSTCVHTLQLSPPVYSFPNPSTIVAPTHPQARAWRT